MTDDPLLLKTQVEHLRIALARQMALSHWHGLKMDKLGGCTHPDCLEMRRLLEETRNG